MAERSVLQNCSLAQTEVSIVERIVHYKGHNSEQVKSSDVVHFEIRDPNFKMRDIDDGSVFPSKRKNSNASPLHKMPYTGTEVVFRVSSVQNSALRVVHLTIALCYYLSDGIQAFFATAGFVLHLNENNCNGINRLEVILHPATKGRVEYYFQAMVVIRPSMSDIVHVEIRVKSDEWGNLINGRTFQDQLQCADIEIMRSHNVEESNFSRRMTCDSGRQHFTKAKGARRALD
ncbi:hypothetical protein BGY98DRAFT_1159455 [Russula aff. rugulosa BPL654]|nr:hypothetical protein BGY98DRAFT_1159455 [Russula aff. rugulosa BPL654]